MNKYQYRLKKAELRPKDKPHIRPNVLVALIVFGCIVKAAILTAVFNPKGYTAELNAMILSALAILAGLFSALTKSEEVKDDSLSDLAKTLAKNGASAKHEKGTSNHASETSVFGVVDVGTQPKTTTHVPSVFTPRENAETPQITARNRHIPADSVRIPEKQEETDENFEDAFAKTLKHEGEWLYSTDTDGNPVYSGINQGHNPDWKGWEHLGKPPKSGFEKVDKPELRELVRKRYKNNYWDHKVCVFFKEWPELRQQVYDNIVRGGYAWRLQETCVKCGVKCDVDGLWGSGTTTAVEQAIKKGGWRVFNNLLVECRLAYVDRTVKKKLVPANMARGLRARMRSWKV